MAFEMGILGDFIRVQGGFAYKSQDFSSTGKNPVLKIKNVRFGVIDYSDTEFVSDELANQTENWATREGDVLISMTGSGPNAPQSLVGRVARIWENEPKSWINQRVGRLQLKTENAIDLDFVFYLLSLPQSQEFLVSNSTGSANQANISAKIIELLPCPKISYDQSKNIADIFKSLDRKIILNRQINQTLEQMAQTLFKSWFVDFDPVIDNALDAGNDIPDTLQDRAEQRRLLRAKADFKPLPAATCALFPSEFEETELGWVPKGWELLPISEAIVINPSVKLAKGSSAKFADMKALPTTGYAIDGIEIKPYAGGAKFQKDDVLLARITPCLENGKTGFVDFLSEDEVGFGSTEFIVMRQTEKVHFGYVACLARNSHFRAHAVQSMVGSSGRQRVQNSCFDDYVIAVPTKSVMHVFAELSESTFNKTKNNNLEITALNELRDNLLPKLISGELVLDDLPEDVAEVAEAV